MQQPQAIFYHCFLLWQVHYIFIHDSVLEAVVCGETQVSASNFRLAMTKLGKVDHETGLNGFELQHQVRASVHQHPHTLMHTATTYCTSIVISQTLICYKYQLAASLHGSKCDFISVATAKDHPQTIRVWRTSEPQSYNLINRTDWK